MTEDDQFEIRPIAGKNFQDRKAVEVKCEIYEPQVTSLNSGILTTFQIYIYM